MLRQIFKHSILYTFASQVPTIVNLFLLPVISPFLSTEDYAIYGLLLAYVGAVSAFSHLGFLVLFQNSFFRDREKFRDEWSHFLAFQQLYKIIYGILLSVMIYFVFSDDAGDKIWTMILLVCIPVVFFDLTKLIGMRLCQFQQKHQLVYRSTWVTGLITASVTFFTVYYLKLGFIGWLIASCTGSFIQFLYFGNFLYRIQKIYPRWKFSWQLIRKGLKVSLPTIPHSYSTYLLNTSDRLVLDWCQVSKYEIGQYNLAYGFAAYFENFNSQVNSVVSPVYYELFAKNDKRANLLVRNITYVWLGVIMITASLVGLWSKEIFSFLYRNAELSSAYPYAIFVLMSFTYRPLYVASVDRAIFHEKTISLLKISTIAGLLNLCLNLIFIPIYGAWAAAINTLISFCYMGVAGHLMKTTKQYLGMNYRVGYIMILVVATAIGIYLLRDAAIWIKVIITVLELCSVVLVYKWKGKVLIHEINRSFPK